ncbi:MAG: preprotein translocase subunit SecG [Mesorhizobium sp.]|uniref:preprotein translocase subunit SecG n=1 Tax=unclassified Mesorhizobium TaxID=325217 RepID=UPI000FCB8944|nr:MULTISPECIES: preprotein translocase subunit SecG [unclassified Mesorhizobium]RUV41336.1 preprotein translocase subunit SecG [Mesorhizobium sp. M1A.T.Ca.IN.004.03.1.1]RWG20145.1 MAG: preprotein translocase subunit SecG [Mesorhizobium sp.]RWI96158.1 MAG: preprotein translocase subunit SecG [Mesorhizobium sp.]RWK36694.1 MAG: preprotein translocase subunit SecG [Mesorhizobium sp.]RWK91468.1 MAG: preprotein translocase subunit SecG [Mesorhizobium sp.]
METVLIVVHLMVVLALVGVVLLQRSEGGGLGIGGGSGFMTARGAANALTRATAILAAAFFVTSLALSILARYGEKPIDILDRAPASTSGNAGKGVLNQLPGATGPVGSSQPAPPAGGTAPAAPSGGTTTTTPLSNGGTTTAPATAPATPAPANPTTPPAANGVTLPVTPQVPNQ